MHGGKRLVSGADCRGNLRVRRERRRVHRRHGWDDRAPALLAAALSTCARGCSALWRSARGSRCSCWTRSVPPPNCTAPSEPEAAGRACLLLLAARYELLSAVKCRVDQEAGEHSPMKDGLQPQLVSGSQKVSAGVRSASAVSVDDGQRAGAGPLAAEQRVGRRRQLSGAELGRLVCKRLHRRPHSHPVQETAQGAGLLSADLLPPPAPACRGMHRPPNQASHATLQPTSQLGADWKELFHLAGACAMNGDGDHSMQWRRLRC